MKGGVTVLMMAVLTMLCVASSGCDNETLSTDAAKPNGKDSIATKEQPTYEGGAQDGSVQSPGEVIHGGSETSTEDETLSDVGGADNFILEYPEELLDDVIITKNEQNGVHTTLFTAKLGESSYDLFAVIFGNGGKGELFGYKSMGDETIPVYIECYSLPEDNSLTERQAIRYYELMDTVNIVTESISASEWFKYN